MADIDFTTPRVVLCIGKPKRGKSNAVKYWILKNTIDNHIFKMGLVFSRTGGLGEEYKYIKPEFVHTGYDIEILGAYIKQLEMYVKKFGKPISNFVVFDDLLGILNKQDKFLMNFIAVHRHLGCSVFFCFQHLNFGTSTTMREITTHALLFNSKSFNTLRALYENFGTLFKNYRTFKKRFLEITEQQYHGMLYEQDIDDIEENYKTFVAPDMSRCDFQIHF